MHEPVSLRIAVDAFSDEDGWTDPEARRRRHNSARMFFNDGQVRSQVPTSRGKTALYGPSGVLVLRLVLFAHEHHLNRSFVAALSDWLHGAGTDLDRAPDDELGKVRSLRTRAEEAVMRVADGEEVALVCDLGGRDGRWFSLDPANPPGGLNEKAAEMLADASIARERDAPPLRLRFDLKAIVLSVLERLADEGGA